MAKLSTNEDEDEDEIEERTTNDEQRRSWKNLQVAIINKQTNKRTASANNQVSANKRNRSDGTTIQSYDETLSQLEEGRLVSQSQLVAMGLAQFESVLLLDDSLALTA